MAHVIVSYYLFDANVYFVFQPPVCFRYGCYSVFDQPYFFGIYGTGTGKCLAYTVFIF